MSNNPGNTLKDTPQHILSCKVLGNTSNVTLDHIHESIEEQQDLAKVYIKLMTKRNKILEEREVEELSNHNQVMPTRGCVPGPEPPATAGGGSCAP